jgi:hypothetical protein
MSNPVDFPQANLTLNAPDGRHETVQPLRAFHYSGQYISCWELTDAELEEVVRTRRVFINVLGGNSQPPIYVWVGQLAAGIL